MTVYLVGAGPGDPGLLTLRGAEVLAAADVVVHDRLADASLVEMAPPSAERVDVGKRPGSGGRQDEINDLLVERGIAGLEVVRLKGGDPFVFGRGGEEAQALLAAGVAFEVVPGVSAALAVPAYAGVPVTHRGMAAAFTVVTGHTGVDRQVDWEALARVGGTVVVLMGVAHRAELSRRLMEGGRAPSTPVVAVSWGTRPSQRSVRTTLEHLGEADVVPPATFVVGPVAGMDLAWYERRPLLGWTVVVTRARGQASELSARLRGAGAETVEVPVISICDPSDRGRGLARLAGRLADAEWVVLSSVNAVERLMAVVRDARAFGRSQIAAVGPGTEAALRRHGLSADLVPDRFVAEALLEAMPPASGTRLALLPLAAGARDVLPAGLRAAGWDVEVAEAYRTEQAGPGAFDLTGLAAADAVTFTSSSTVEGFVKAAGTSSLPPLVACIGPVTAATAGRLGLEVDLVAEDHSIAGLVEALVRHRLEAPG